MEVNQVEFAHFLAFIHGDAEFRTWEKLSSHKLAGAIATLEAERIFEEGQPYCQSAFYAESPNGWGWIYKMTSGTELKVAGCRDPLGGLYFEITTPGVLSMHFDLLTKIRVHGWRYYSEYEMTWAIPGSDAWHQSIIQCRPSYLQYGTQYAYLDMGRTPRVVKLNDGLLEDGRPLTSHTTLEDGSVYRVAHVGTLEECMADRTPKGTPGVSDVPDDDYEPTNSIAYSIH